MEVRVADCPLGAKCEEAKIVEGKQVLFRCPWYVQVRGKDPQSDKEIDQWSCAIAWMPILLIENAKEVRQHAAATESFRNQVVVQGRNLQTQAANFQRLLQRAKAQFENRLDYEVIEGGNGGN